MKPKKIVIPSFSSGDTTQYSQLLRKSGYNPISYNGSSTIGGSFYKNKHGLLLPGDGDLDPKFWGVKNFYSMYTNQFRDFQEMDLLKMFIDLGKPVFGICRGMQLIFRYFWKHKILPEEKFKPFIGQMGFRQHLRTHYNYVSLLQNNYKTKHKFKNPYIHRNFKVHSVTNLSSGEIKEVNSLHHQGITIKKDFYEKVQEGGEFQSLYEEFPIKLDWVCAENKFNSKDELLIEGIHIELEGIPKISGVQWHPEELLEEFSRELLENYF